MSISEETLSHYRVQIEEWKKSKEFASPGPWTVEHLMDEGSRTDEWAVFFADKQDSTTLGPFNAQFIAHAYNTPIAEIAIALLNEVERLNNVILNAQHHVERWQEAAGIEYNRAQELNHRLESFMSPGICSAEDLRKKFFGEENPDGETERSQGQEGQEIK